MKTKAVLIVALIVACCGNAVAQQSAGQSLRRLQRQGQEVADRDEHCSAVQGVPGVTAPLIPFEAKDKIKYEDAVERAKMNDPEAYYWLAYYFANGEGVENDKKAAGAFLQKSADGGYAKAYYLLGLYHECCTLKYGNDNVIHWRDEFESVAYVSMFGVLCGKFDGDALKKPDRPANASPFEWYCCTNEVMSGFVADLYSSAVKGGLSYATNDIALLNWKIAESRARITARESAKIKRAAALDLLVDNEEKNRQEEQLRQQEESKRQQEENDRQKEYWSTWPRDLSNEEYGNLLCDAEEKYDSVILGLEYLVNSTRASSTNTWNIGCGRNLIKADECFVRKIDKEGRVVWLGGSERANDVEEIRWYNEERSRLLEAKRVKWAEEHGMTVEEASRKYDEWSRRPRSLLGLSRRPTTQLLPSGSKTLLGTGGSLRERRAARDQARQEELAKEKELEAKRKAEAAEKEKEREAQRQAEREEARRELKLLKDELEAQRKAAERARAERERGNN